MNDMMGDTSPWPDVDAGTTILHWWGQSVQEQLDNEPLRPRPFSWHHMRLNICHMTWMTEPSQTTYVSVTRTTCED